MNRAEELGHIAALQQGSRESFRWLYDQYFSQIYGFCKSLIPRVEDAEEIAADVFVTIWRRREVLLTNRSLQPLLFKITRDLAWNHLRRIAVQKSNWADFISAATAKTTETVPEFFDQESERLLEKAIGFLPPQQERIFRLRFLQGLELSQIAEELRISKNTVKVHLARSKSLVQGRLSEET